MRIASARVHHESVPITRPVATAFGVMRERHALFLLLRDDAGHVGIGESWVNFPLWAPWERRAAFERGLIPWLVDREVEDVPATMGELWRAFRGPAVQSGTVGPLLGALCAVELALWDLAAQAAGLPLAHLLWDAPRDATQVYASGINSPLPWELIHEHLDRGVTLFKLKLGFGDDADRRHLDELAEGLRGRARLAVDVNRGWSLDGAHAWLETLAAYEVQWLEEPLRVEDEARGLPELAARGLVPLAGGENTLLPPGSAPGVLLGTPFHVLQPDMSKYASVSAVLATAAALPQGRRLIPHFLGSAPGGAASLHVAAGLPEGLCEWDINDNPLRTELYEQPFEIVDGCIALPERPGLGWTLRG